MRGLRKRALSHNESDTHANGSVSSHQALSPPGPAHLSRGTRYGAALSDTGPGDSFMYHDLRPVMRRSRVRTPSAKRRWAHDPQLLRSEETVKRIGLAYSLGDVRRDGMLFVGRRYAAATVDAVHERLYVPHRSACHADHRVRATRFGLRRDRRDVSMTAAAARGAGPPDHCESPSMD